MLCSIDLKNNNTVNQGNDSCFNKVCEIVIEIIHEVTHIPLSSLKATTELKRELHLYSTDLAELLMNVEMHLKINSIYKNRINV